MVGYLCMEKGIHFVLIDSESYDEIGWVVHRK
jgi:hypothetical protein